MGQLPRVEGPAEAGWGPRLWPELPEGDHALCSVVAKGPREPIRGDQLPVVRCQEQTWALARLHERGNQRKLLSVSQSCWQVSTAFPAAQATSLARAHRGQRAGPQGTGSVWLCFACTYQGSGQRGGRDCAPSQGQGERPSETHQPGNTPPLQGDVCRDGRSWIEGGFFANFYRSPKIFMTTRDGRVSLSFKNVKSRRSGVPPLEGLTEKGLGKSVRLKNGGDFRAGK